jgi:hypothetical protein
MSSQSDEPDVKIWNEIRVETKQLDLLRNSFELGTE